jgi:hypothetical protein
VIEVKYLTREDLLIFLRGYGYPVTKGTLNKLCAPACNEGPKPVAVWPGAAGRHEGRPLYEPSAALAWAEKRLRRPSGSTAPSGSGA